LRDPATLPLRQWLYGRHLIRKFVSATFAPGGLGKTALTLAEAAAMASGKALLGVMPRQRCRVWVWCGEDPLEETERRLAAIAIHYGLAADDLEGWLFVGSGRDADLIIAEQRRDQAVISVPNVDALRKMIRVNRIDVAIIDPFVSSHRVGENDNNAIDAVVKAWARIADETDSAIELVHHTRKAPAGYEISVDHGRGASALLYAVRSARTLNPMSEEEGARAGVDCWRSCFRVDAGKANLSPPSEASEWRRFVSVSLGNGGLEGGDSVGVVTPWTWPDPVEEVSAADLAAIQQKIAAGAYRESAQATNWGGRAVAEVLDLDLGDKAARARVSSLLKAWLKDGTLVIVKRQDERRETRPFLDVGRWVR
jgi:hypothetical protein